MTGILKRLLVATDGSSSGERVVAFAIALARTHGSEIILCCATDRADAALDDDVAAILAAAAKHVSDAGVVVTQLTLEGRPAHAIVKCAKDHHVDAIVMGTQGKTGVERFFLGSTATGVLRRTDVPTFVLPPLATAIDAGFGRIVIAVDDSDPSDAAVAFAIDVAQTDQSKLIFCSAIETSDVLERAVASGYDRISMLEEFRAFTQTMLAAHADRARALGVAVENVVAEGDPTDMILKATETHNANLIVVGTHGRRGLRQYFIGSVAEGIVRQSPVPVVVLRASHLRAAMDLAS